MPNLDFYAVGPDLDAAVDVIFAQPGCRVFESYSEFGRDIVEFTSVTQLRAALSSEAFQGTGQQLLLQIALPGAPFNIERISIDPKACGGHRFRYCVEGWGLIQFYLGGLTIHGMVNSHTNHNSLARAKAWEPVIAGPQPVDQWNWKSVGGVSSRINRMIRKLAVGKLDSRPVLPAAAAALAGGTPIYGLGPTPRAFEPF
jgi:hypothetical protein